MYMVTYPHFNFLGFEVSTAVLMGIQSSVATQTTLIFFWT